MQERMKLTSVPGLEKNQCVYCKDYRIEFKKNNVEKNRLIRELDDIRHIQLETPVNIFKNGIKCSIYEVNYDLSLNNWNNMRRDYQV